jgi:hypothetical protein
MEAENLMSSISKIPSQPALTALGNTGSTAAGETAFQSTAKEQAPPAKEVLSEFGRQIIPESVRDPYMATARTESERIGNMLDFNSGYSFADAQKAARDQANEWSRNMPREVLLTIEGRLQNLNDGSGSFEAMQGASLLLNALDEVLWP